MDNTSRPTHCNILTDTETEHYIQTEKETYTQTEKHREKYSSRDTGTEKLNHRRIEFRNNRQYV